MAVHPLQLPGPGCTTVERRTSLATTGKAGRSVVSTPSSEIAWPGTTAEFFPTQSPAGPCAARSPDRLLHARGLNLNRTMSMSGVMVWVLREGSNRCSPKQREVVTATAQAVAQGSRERGWVGLRPAMAPGSGGKRGVQLVAAH